MIPTYYHRVPLPRIPGYHKLDKQARLADVHDRHASTTYAHAASNTWHARLTSLLRSISKHQALEYIEPDRLLTRHFMPKGRTQDRPSQVEVGRDTMALAILQKFRAPYVSPIALLPRMPPPMLPNKPSRRWAIKCMFLLAHCPWLFDPGAFAGRPTDTCQGELS